MEFHQFHMPWEKKSWNTLNTSKYKQQNKPKRLKFLGMMHNRMQQICLLLFTMQNKRYTESNGKVFYEF